MSGSTPTPASGIPRTTQTGNLYTSQGMIAPGNPFVQPDLSPTAVSFRFLYSLLSNVNNLQSQIDTINQRLTNAGIP